MFPFHLYFPLKVRILFGFILRCNNSKTCNLVVTSIDNNRLSWLKLNGLCVGLRLSCLSLYIKFLFDLMQI